MSDRNKATLQMTNAAIDYGDTEGFLSHCTEDVEWTSVGEQTLKGKAAVRYWMATAYAAPPKYTVTDLLADGDVVIALGSIWPNDQDGRTARHSYCDVWRFRGGKMAELTAFVIKSEPD